MIDSYFRKFNINGITTGYKTFVQEVLRMTVWWTTSYIY
jgi:hypothetical protein